MVLSLLSADPNGVEHPSVVEGADAEPAVGEGPIVSGHSWRFHVVEVNLDQAILDRADDPDMVPAVGPGRSSGPLLGDRDAGLAVDLEDAIGSRIGLLAQMDVVEVAGILVVEEQAEVAVPVVASG